ncbi:MAG: hypothetical protein ACI9MC_001055 [Kiritimatiellia bacterium]
MICLVHCTVLPLVAALFPAVTLVTDALWVHGALLLMVVPAGVFAFVRGYPVHRHRWVPVLGAVGLTLVTSGTFIGLSGGVLPEVALILAGCAALLPAHWANWRLATSAAVHGDPSPA